MTHGHTHEVELLRAARAQILGAQRGRDRAVVEQAVAGIAHRQEWRAVGVAFDDGQPERLFAIHVFARLTGPDRDQRMPMIRRRDGNRVHLLVFEQLSDVLVFLDAFKVLGSAFKDVEIHVAERDDPCALHFTELTDVRSAPAVDADHGHADEVIGPDDL